MMIKEGAQAAAALKEIARNSQLKAYVQQSEWFPLLRRAAKRYVPAETIEDALTVAVAIVAHEYAVSLEFIGENTDSPEACMAAKAEFLQLIRRGEKLSKETTVSFDLSHIGLSVDRRLAARHLHELAEEASKRGIVLMVSMEEAEKTGAILELYTEAAAAYPDVLGITIQAHQHRSADDLHKLLAVPGRIRLVKGAFLEPAEVALPRSEALLERYVDFAKRLIKAGKPVSIATHDQRALDRLNAANLLKEPHVELEMLYGIAAERLLAQKLNGCKTRVYVPYGVEWYLYLCHRLAEYPPNLYDAVADLVHPERTERLPYV
ncbi:proline dehydrogenase family protein [Brevibacillus fluminis]|uniref:proline dehydrogenase family protein n=1 Tax=Brevibacillus fluminis TaxID=511487 RepID=UPI003F8A5C1E